jgi:transposase
MRHALNPLAVVAPTWWHTHSQPEWLERYGARVEEDHVPKGEPQRRASAQTVGAEGAALLDAIAAQDAPQR